MTYRDLFSHAQWKLDHNEITLGEYEEMTKPLNREVDVLDKIRAEIEGLTYYWCEVNPKSVIDDVLQIINKYRNEVNE